MSRISFEVEPKVHRVVKITAASQGITVRQFMLEALNEHLKQHTNRQDTEETLGIYLAAFERDWNNERDAEYDALGSGVSANRHPAHVEGSGAAQGRPSSEPDASASSA